MPGNMNAAAIARMIAEPNIELDGPLAPGAQHRLSQPTHMRETHNMRIVWDRMHEFCDDQAGASAAEYAMILAIAGSAVAAAAIFLGGAITSAVNSAGSCITTKGATC